MENTAADSSISRWNFCTRGAPDAGDMEKEANAALLSTGWATRIRYTDLREIETAFPSRLDDSSMSSGKSSPWSQESGDEPLIASQQRRQFFNTARRTPGLPPSFLRRVEPSRHRFSVKDSSSVSRAGLLGEFRGILRRKVEQCSILSKQTQLRAAMQSRSISRCNHLRSVRSVKSSIRDRIDNLPLRLRGSLALGERRVVLSPPALRTTGGGSQASKKTRVSTRHLAFSIVLVTNKCLCRRHLSFCRQLQRPASRIQLTSRQETFPTFWLNSLHLQKQERTLLL